MSSRRVVGQSPHVIVLPNCYPITLSNPYIKPPTTIDAYVGNKGLPDTRDGKPFSAQKFCHERRPPVHNANRGMLSLEVIFSSIQPLDTGVQIKPRQETSICPLTKPVAAKLPVKGISRGMDRRTENP